MPEPLHPRVRLLCAFTAALGGACHADPSPPVADSSSVLVPNGSGGGAEPASIGTCDRGCLIDALSNYLSALVAHDPQRVGSGAGVKFTENGVVMTLGSGLWQTATAVRDQTRLDFADPVLGQVGSQLVAEEGDEPVLLQVRLKLQDRVVVESETIVMRQTRSLGFDPAGMEPSEVFRQPIAAEARISRDAMRAITDPYLDALETGDFSKTAFDEQVVRTENGVQTADYVALTQRSTAAPTGRAIVRRYIAFDEEYGLVFGMFPFTASANAMVASEVFKVADGKIRMINVVLTTMPTKAWPAKGSAALPAHALRCVFDRDAALAERATQRIGAVEALGALGGVARGERGLDRGVVELGRGG